MRVINPTTEEQGEEYADHTAEEVKERLQRANAAFATWRQVPVGQRAQLMGRAAEVLRSRAGEWAAMMTREMGKPIVGAEQEIEKCAVTCEYFAEHGPALLAGREVPSDAKKSYVRYDPIGAVLAIMPWNFPFWQVIRFAAPTLVAGNVGLLKHAPNVPGCSAALEELFVAAGFPTGVFTSLRVATTAVEEILAQPIVQAVTLTGSGRAGSAVAAIAGRLLKKSVMELGGSDPFIVLADADVKAVAAIAAQARCINSGQSCIAAKRFIVEESIADAFEKHLVESMAALKVGDPMDRTTALGPMAREDLLQALHEQVVATIKAGATLLAGGRHLPQKGYFYEPTVLGNVKPGMPAFDQETFGPVAAVIRAASPAAAVELANQSIYGLGASIWTRDVARAEVLAGQIEAGSVFINGAVKSDARLPFGGIKASGYGRELAREGIHEFVNIKTVWMKGAGD